ncbi:ras-induced vulval development antagonist-domain-containing protein [Lentinula raphanica]|nr:ras-induced vulval development antagonist-domain-containing protein [Lentinula raphanica]
MAMVHPSRMGLVPQDSSSRRRSPSPPSSRRSISPRRKPDARSSHRDSVDDRDRNRARDRYPSRQEDDYDDDRSRGRNRDRERAMDRGERRRASPKYEDYGRPSSPRNDSAPRQQGENMYPNRDRPDFGRDPPPHNGYASSRSGGGADFFERHVFRRLQRETMTVNIWPPSPKAPARDLSPKRSSKKSKRQPSISSDTDSEEEERRRRERKERKKRKEQRKEEKREKKRKRSRSRRRSDDEEEYRRLRRKSFSKSKSPQRAASRSRRTHSPSLHNDDDEWVVKDTGSGAMLPPPLPIPEQVHPTNPNHDVGSDEDDDLVGPQPAPRANAKRVDERSYGGALLRGEGSAMAAFLQDGTEARIPRRGEIGLTSDEIAKYEDVGYVMSGSRHRRMNAVRIRKENQVISAEEKRGILKLQKEERERREAILREEFSELVQESLKGAEKPKAG